MLSTEVRLYTVIDSGLLFDTTYNTPNSSTFMQRIKNFNHIMSKDFFNFCNEKYTINETIIDGEISNLTK